ncbi:MAG: metallophosphoesterase, partial [Sphingobacterium siyangense]
MAKRLLLILFLFVLGDIYFFQAFSTVIRGSIWQNMYWGIDILLFFGVFTLIFLRRAGYDVQQTATSLITAFL